MFITISIVLTEFRMSVDPAEIIIATFLTWKFVPNHSYFENFSIRCFIFVNISFRVSTCICVGAAAGIMENQNILFNIISTLH